MKNRAKAAEYMRRWRRKNKQPPKKQAKTGAQRQREYRERRKLAEQQSYQDLDTTASSSSYANQRARTQAYHERRSYNTNTESNNQWGNNAEESDLRDSTSTLNQPTIQPIMKIMNKNEIMFMDEPIQMDIKVEEEQILCQYYQQNVINSSNIQLEKTCEVNKQATKDGAEGFDSISALSTNYCDMENYDYDDGEEHECTLCARLFQSEKLFKEHIKKHLKLDSGGEEECQTIKDFDTKNADHQSIPSEKSAQVHTGERPYECHICSKIFKNAGPLKKHLSRHKYGRPYQCEVCSKSFAYPSNFEDHMRVHTGERPYGCDLCSKKFKCTGELKKHKRTHSGERPYKCETCSKSFHTTSALKKHMYKHTGDHPYKCEICGKKCSELCYYKIHMRGHTGERPYKCEICSKTFQSINGFTDHKRIHSEEPPFTCEICSKSFFIRSAFNKHKRIHSEEPPFTCDICSKSFFDRSAFNIHMRVHTGERPYKCEICSKAFKSTSAIRLHERRHAKRPFQCDQCPKKCSTKEECQKHALKH